MAQPLRVLLLEDTPSDARLIISELKRSNFEPLWERVDSEQEFVGRLSSSWDVILADYCLPQFDAARALQHLHSTGRDIPFIIVSGSIGEETAVAAIREGATDYLLKDRLGRLGPAITHALEQRQMRETRRKAEENVRERTQLIHLSAEIGLALNRSGTVQEMLDKCAQSLVTILDAAFARIWTLSPDKQLLELQASAGVHTQLDGPHSKIPVGSYKIGRIAQQRIPHMTNDVLNDPLISDREWVQREGMVSFAGYPLIVEDRLVGVMALFARQELAPTTLDAMGAVANQIAAGVERKRAEERLRFTQFTIDHIATPVLWSDEDGRFFNVNEAGCRLSGYSREELCNLYVSDLTPSIPRQIWGVVWQDLHKRGTLSLESYLQCKDGRQIPVSVNSNLLVVDGAECSCTFLQDITERKQAELAQQQSELRFLEIFKQLQLQIERMPLAYLLLDSDCRIVDWNPAAERTFGYRKEEVIGMGPPFEKIVPASLRETTHDVLQRLKAGDMTAHAVHDNLTKDGRLITCEWINTPLMSEEGRFTGLMSLAQDVTERKRLEEQFRQAQKMEAIGKLAGGVAHDFNNLLTIILGYSDILQESIPEGDPLRELAEQIYKSGTRAAGLTRQLLAFSRKQVLVPILIDLNSLVSDMEKMLVRLIGEDLKLSFHPADNLWRIKVDPGQMEQVVMNLVVNSRDAMPRGGQLTIETSNVVLSESYAATQPDALPGQYVLLAVSDTGCGMDAATQVRIFEPFFSTKGDKGTGLGLATVYGIVKQSGGHIVVSSELGRGTTFRVYFPREITADDGSPELADDKATRKSYETVLLVEDEEAVRSFARAALQRFGYTVLEAGNGHEALELCNEHPETIHLLATDVIMPNMSGRELAERLTSLRPKLKVLFMSGYMDDAIIRHGLAHGKVPFLQKPYTLAALAQKVREVLDASD